MKCNPDITYLLKKYLVFEDVYYDDVFEQLTKFILHKLDDSSVLRMTFKEILDKLPDWWPGKKYLKKEKNLIVIKINFNDKVEIVKCLTKLNLSENEFDSIENRLYHDRGLFCSQLDNYDKKDIIIFINSGLIDYDIYDVLCHELIHLFQSISGRSIYKINNKNKIVNLSEKDEENIQDILKINKDMIKKIFDPTEITTYTKEAYSYIKRNTNFTEKIDMNLFFADIDSCLRNKTNINSFKEYFNNIKHNCKDENIRKIFIDNKNKPIVISMIIISYYLGLGINTIKNHLYGYMNKDNWDKIKE